MDVGKGWDAGDALPSAPAAADSSDPGRGQLHKAPGMDGEEFIRAGDQFVPPSRSVGAQPAAVAAPGSGFGPSPGWLMGQDIPGLNKSPNPYGSGLPARVARGGGAAAGEAARVFHWGRNGETICVRRFGLMLQRRSRSGGEIASRGFATGFQCLQSALADK